MSWLPYLSMGLAFTSLGLNLWVFLMVREARRKLREAETAIARNLRHSVEALDASR
jgi:hypothetical protein